MELSENLKIHLDNPSGETQQDRLARPSESGSSGAHGHGESGPIDEAESQMRKALGLLGESSRHRPDSDRSDMPSRGVFNGGLHRRRFVQDGDIPVTVLRRDQPHEAPPHRGVAAPPPPTTSRLQRTEAALAAETAARDKAERLLAETQNVMRDLRTKIGHAELAKNEAVEALRHERDSIGQFRTEIEALRQQLEEAHAQVQAAERHAHTVQEHLTEERQARRVAEKALRASETALETAEQLVRTLSEEKPAPRRVAEPPPRRAPVMREPEVVAAPVKRARVAPAAAAVPAAEPEPVKWWLNTKPSAKKR
jgi:hypothetical protein